MRLGIAAAEMEGEATGVGRFVSGLLEGLAETDFDGQVHAFYQGRPFDHPLWDDPRIEPHFSAHQGSSVVWEQRRLPRLLDGLDLFFGPAYSLPPRLPCPGVVMIHDLSFEVLPEEFGLRERWRRRFLARRAARVATRVLTVSRHVASELETRYAVAAGRIGVLHHGVDTGAFHLGATAAVQHVTPPYLVFVGALLRRRCPELMLDAFARVAGDRPELSLALVGPDRLRGEGDMSRWIAERGLADRVRRVGWVPEKDLPGLVAGAEASVYLSTYEGFGIPPLESLACGTLPVVSDGLALDDLWPDFPYRCESLEADAVARTLARVLERSAEREAAVAKGLTLVRGLTWKSCAESFLREIAGLA